MMIRVLFVLLLSSVILLTEVYAEGYKTGYKLKSFISFVATWDGNKWDAKVLEVFLYRKITKLESCLDCHLYQNKKQ